MARTDPRGLEYLERICHLGCLDEGAAAPCAICGEAITGREKPEQTECGLCHTKRLDVWPLLCESQCRIWPAARDHAKLIHGSGGC